MLNLLIAASLLSVGPGPGEDKTVVVPGRAPVEQALFNPDGRRIYFSTYAGVEGYDIETGKWLFSGAYGREITCSPKGDLVAAIRREIGMLSIGGRIAVLDSTSGKLLHEGTGTSAHFSPDSRWLLTHSMYTVGYPKTDKPPKLQITDLRTGKMYVAQFPEEKAKNPGWGGGPAEIFDFTKDGKSIVFRATNAAGQFKSFAACDLETGKLLETLPKDEELHLVPSPQHSADGKRFVNDWKVLDVESGKVIAKLEAWKHPNSDGWRPWFQISADGKSVFSVTSGRNERKEDEKSGRTSVTLSSRLHVWDADTGKWKDNFVDASFVESMPNVTLKKLGRFRLSGPRFAVNSKATRAVDYSADAVNVWDLTTGKRLRKMRDTGHTAPPVFLRFSPDGNSLASATREGEVLLWNAQTGQPSGALDVAADLNDIGFRPKSKELVGVGHGFIYVWDFTTGALKQTFEHSGYPARVVGHPDGKIAAVADHRTSFSTFFDLESGKSLHSLYGSPVSLAFSPDGASLASLDGHGNVTTWDTSTGKKIHGWPEGKSGDNRYVGKRIAFLPGAKSLFVCKNDNVVILDTESGKRLREFTFKNQDRREVSDADVHPDGKRFVVAFDGKQDIEERDLESGKVLRAYPGYPHGASQLRYSPDGSRLATTGAYSFELHFHPVPARAD